MYKNDPRPITSIQLFSKNCTALFDSGATHSAISTDTANELKPLGGRSFASSFRITDVQGNDLKVTGEMSIPVKINNCVKNWKFLIIDNLSNKVIVGADFMKANNLSLNMTTRQIVFADNVDKTWTKRTIHPACKTFIAENTHAKFRCTIEVPTNINLTPGSLVITKRSEIKPGVFVEESITKVLRNNRIFIVATNSNPYPIFLKTTDDAGEVSDTPPLQIIPIDEAHISAFGTEELTGAIPKATSEKLAYLKANIQCPSEISDEVKSEYVKLILQNHDVFASDKFDLGFTDVISHKINMKTQQPVYTKQFRIPDTHQKEILDHIVGWQKQNVIEECASPFNSPVFCVPKKGGGLRIVQDLREINKAAFEDKYAIKDVQECVDVIGNANSRIFSTLDMASGFWQQNLDEASRDYTAFTIPLLNTQFRWNRNVMGLHGASSSFSRLTALIFRDVQKAITYIDDVLTHSETHFEQRQILQECFNRMRQYNMKFNIKKCVFGATDVTYLGYKISSHGVSPANDKVQAIKAFQAPTTMKEVRAFIGFCNYFRRMIPNFSRMAHPLIAMTRKDAGWKAGELPAEAMRSFDQLKTALSEQPVIGFSKSNGQYVLTVDAATTGLGAILSQINGQKETIISYWSRTLREHEKNYTPFMLEMTAVCSALEHFHENITGKKIIVYTDHKPLLGTSTMQKKTINRLVENMNVYNIDLRYKKGTENQGADYLSRHAHNEIIALTHQNKRNEIRIHQKNDAVTNGIRIFLEQNHLPAEEKLMKTILGYASRSFLKDGLLWYVHPKSNISQAVLFAPKSMINDIITAAHGSPMSGHWALERTVQRIGSSYFWPTMCTDIAIFIDNCGRCQRAQRPPKNAELAPWPQASKPNERIHIDLYGALRGDATYKYVAVITCAFTKWTEVIPLTDKEAPTVAKAVFEEWICRRGVMNRLVSDGGKEFANQILDELCKLMKIDKHVVTAYHPMANGQVERFNRDMRKYLLTMMDDTKDWVAYLKPLQFAHNTAMNKSTKFTPHFLTFLDDPRLPDSLATPNVTYSSSYSADAFRRMQYAYQLVYKNNEEARNAYTSHFNEKARTRKFDIGDEVLVSFPIHPKTVNRKLASIWRGPFAIVKIFNNIIVDLKASPRSKIIKVHVNRIRLFRHLDDLITTEYPNQKERNIEEPTNKEDDDDDDIGEHIFDDNTDAVQEDAPAAAVQPAIPIHDQLAQEFFGRTTRARGNVPNIDLPKRPLEYKRYQRKH